MLKFTQIRTVRFYETAIDLVCQGHILIEFIRAINCGDIRLIIDGTMGLSRFTSSRECLVVDGAMMMTMHQDNECWTNSSWIAWITEGESVSRPNVQENDESGNFGL